MLVYALLFVSECLRWFPFNHHKGWTVLIAVASTGVTVIVLLAWCGASLAFRWRFQITLRCMLFLPVLVAIPFGWLAAAMNKAKEQREVVETLSKLGGVTLGHEGRAGETFSKEEPTPKWLQDLLGVNFFADVSEVCVVGPEVTDATLEHLTGMTSVEVLEICNTQVTDAGLKRLKGLNNLRFLVLSQNEITNAGMEYIGGLSRLEALDVSYTRITDAGLEWLKGLTNLRYLAIANTRTTDAGLKHLKTLTCLQQLILNGTEVTGRGFEQPAGLAGLQDLQLISTGITDNGLQFLRGLTNLRHLRLYEDHVTTAGVKELEQVLPRCEIDWVQGAPGGH